MRTQIEMSSCLLLLVHQSYNEFIMLFLVDWTTGINASYDRDILFHMTMECCCTFSVQSLMLTPVDVIM